MSSSKTVAQQQPIRWPATCTRRNESFLIILFLLNDDIIDGIPNFLSWYWQKYLFRPSAWSSFPCRRRGCQRHRFYYTFTTTILYFCVMLYCIIHQSRLHSHPTDTYLYTRTHTVTCWMMEKEGWTEDPITRAETTDYSREEIKGCYI